MFDVFVYLYEIYYCFDVCFEFEVFVKKLFVIGFEEDEIFQVFGWLIDFEVVNYEFVDNYF